MALTGLGTEVAIYCPSLDDTGNGTGTLTDLSELHSDGTITGASWVADSAEGGVRALSFDGTNDLVSIGNIGFGSDPWSIGLWVKFTDFSDFAPLVVFTSATEDFEPGIYGNTQGNSSNTLGSWWESGDPDNGYDSTGTFSADTWYHVGVSYGADGIMRYYIDGVARGSTNWGTIATGNSTIYLAHQPSTLFGRLLLDDIRFFAVQLPVGDFETLATSRGEGLVEDGGILEVTEEDDTLASTAETPVAGTLDSTESDDTLASTASVTSGATLEATEADDVLLATGENFTNTGFVTVTEFNDTLAATIATDISGSLTVTEVDDTLAANANNNANAGSVTVVESPDTLVASIVMSVSGELTSTEGDDVSSGYANQDPRRSGFFVKGFALRTSLPSSIFIGA